MSCRTFKYRLYPNNEQREALFSIFNFCKNLYNSALEERNSYYKKYKKSLSYNTQASYLREIKSLFPEETTIIHSQVLQQTLKQLELSFSNFFKRCENGDKKKGYPRFKTIDRFRSILFPQVFPDLSGGPIKLIDNNHLKISGIESPVRIKYHRPIEGIAKQCRIVKNNDKFYICVICYDVPDKIIPKTNKTIAIDLGIETFATQDDGVKHHHPKPYKTSLEKLKYHQRKLELKKKGSNNRKKQKKIISKIHEKISNIREDFQHKLVNKLIEENDIIIVEDLNIKSMMENENSQVNKGNIQDASWGKFIHKLTYKAESADKLIIKVNPRNTSKMCSCCKNIKTDLTLRDREYHCQSCGLAIDRDVNAAINIKSLGTSDAISKGSQKPLPKS